MKPRTKNINKIKIDKVKRKLYSKENLEKALVEISKGMSKKLAAKTFQVPRSTIQFRLKNPEHASKPGPPTILNNEEEEALVNWIKLSSRKGFPKRKEDLIKSVSEFLKKSNRASSFKNGEKWFKLFLARHPTLAFRKPEAVTAASSTVSENDVRGWFRQIKDYFDENNLFHILSDPRRVFNGDETNFVLCPKTGLVLSSKGERNVYEVDHAQAKTSLTVMFTFCADGNLTPPMVIFPNKRLPAEITSKIPEDWGVGLSEKGWMNSDIFYKYIKNVLHPHLVKIGTIFPVILFVDGHKSHLTYAVSELCSNLQIVLISLYPNCTRLLQPADVASFKPLKTEWQKTVLEWRRTNPSQALTKTQFVPLLKVTIEKSIKPQTIINGFRATGICPWNAEAVDYSKCLGTKGEKTTSPQSKAPQITRDSEKLLSKNEFVKLLGKSKVDCIEKGELTSEESIELIKRIWHFFGTPSNSQNTISQKENLNIEIINKDDDFSNLDIKNLQIFINDWLAKIISLNPKNQIQCNPSLTASMPMKNLTPVKLNDILTLPKTPIRKGAKNSVKIPFVLTSAQWKAQESEKIRIKEEKAEGVKKRKEERERKKIEKEKRPAPKKQNKNKAKDEISKILFSEKFYKFDSEDTKVENKENDQELINIYKERTGGSIDNRTYTNAEIEKMLTELDDLYKD
ncbi:unnamed protein product [Euphydryas editha]|uniref:HTH CENPB-type domain-containing protein n=1 Tax=Euphydryas editha TaxID=104508 RepID=A0AAU9UVT2_EUPED|nr:unnamed protein product [Euphydryas editha]